MRSSRKLTEMLSLEKVGKGNLEDTLASLRANLALAETRARPPQGRQRRGLRPAATPRQRTFDPARQRRRGLTTARDGAGRASQPADRRAAAPGLPRSRLRSKRRENKDKENRRRAFPKLGQRLNLALAQARAGAFRVSARSSSGACARFSATGRTIRVVGDRFRVPVGGVSSTPVQAILKGEGPRPSSTKLATRADRTGKKQIPSDVVAWVLRVDGHTDVASNREARHFLRTGSFRAARARSRWCST